MYSEKFRRHSVAAMLMVVCASGALAEPLQLAAGAAPKHLGEIVVNGSRNVSLPKDLPATTEGLTAQQMTESINVVNTEDAFKYLPSIQIRKRFTGDTNGIVASRTAGTLTSARSLVYGDNLLLSNLLGNSFAYPPRWGLVTAGEIERIDVIYGPFSALYPGNASGSVLLMTTRMPEQFEAHAAAQYFSQDYELYGASERYDGQHLTAGLGSRSGDWSWLLDMDRIDSHGQPMSFLTKPVSTTNAGGADTVVTGARRDIDATGKWRMILGPTSITHTIQDHAKFKLAYDITPTLRAAYTFGLWQNAAQASVASYLRDAAGAPVYSGNVNIDGKRYTLAATDLNPSRSDQEHLMHGLTLKTNTRAAWDWEAVVSLYDYRRDRTRTPTVALPAADAGGAGRITDMQGTGWQSLDLRGVWRPSGDTFGAPGAHEVSFGVHTDHYKLRTQVSNTASWISGDATTRVSGFTGDTETSALYAQDIWRFSPDWKATVGGRWEQWKAHDGTISDATKTLPFATRKESYFSPKLGLAWRVAPLWSLRAAYGQAYRMPTVAELYQGSISANTIVKNDPDLKPEKTQALELTAERDLGNGLLRVSLFQDNTRDALYSQTNISVTPNVTNIQNIDKIRTDGVEVAYQASDVGIQGLDLNGSVTYANSVIKQNNKNPLTTGKKQPRIPDWRATLSATYRADDHWSYSAGARYSGRQFNTIDNSDVNPDVYGGTSSFLIVDARVRYKVNRQWSAAVGVDNLNNAKAYVAHPYPQRTLLAELKFDY